jgi:outer membrane murein-binding lipoprotein Lpp
MNVKHLLAVGAIVLAASSLSGCKTPSALWDDVSSPFQSSGSSTSEDKKASTSNPATSVAGDAYGASRIVSTAPGQPSSDYGATRVLQ